jgi:DNA-binding transcriptional LysR family regulator
MQALEAELDTPLFERLGKRITLTGAGRRLLPYAEQMLRLAAEARSVVATGDEPGGTLIVGAPESLCAYRLPPVLSRFRQRFPRVELIVRPGVCADFRRDLAEGRLDVGFLLEPPLVQPNLHVEPLVAEPLHLVTYPGHPLTRLPRVEPRNLAGEPLLLTEVGCSYREPFEHTLTRAAARPGVVLEFGSVEAIKQCVMAGMGLSFLPAIAVEAELAQGRLIALPWTAGDYGLMTQIAWHRDKWLSPALRALIDLSREVLGESRSPTLVPSQSAALA